MAKKQLSKKEIEAAERVEASRLVRKNFIVTVAIETLLEREAETQARSTSYVMREILGDHYGLPVSLSNPPPKRRQGDSSRG